MQPRGKLQLFMQLASQKLHIVVCSIKTKFMEQGGEICYWDIHEQKS